MTTQKPGIKTTEFWLSAIAVLLGVLISAGLVDPEGTSEMDQIAGVIVAGLGSAGYAVSRGKAKSNSGKASFSAIAPIALVLFFLMPSCGLLEAPQGVDPQYLKADRATYEAIGEEWADYVQADDTLTVEQKQRRDLLLNSWRIRIENAEAAAGVER